MLRVVDISGYQAGINAGTLDCDAVIVKVTGGDYFTNQSWREQVESALAGGKRLGLYHYARDSHGGYSTPEIEARRFLDAIQPYIGQAVLVLDWEAEADAYPISWAREWCDIVARETGSTPMMYVGAYDANNRDFSAVSMYPLWMACYLYKYFDVGWVDNPDCTYGSGNWPRITMYQYTSTGRIGGYDSTLDLSVFYGNADEWDALIGGGYSTTAQDLIDVAYSYLGTTEDDPRFYELIEYYNEHTDGYDMSLYDEWCACFVSVCSLKSGNAEATGTSVNCATFRNIWREKGIYREPWEVPQAGWLIDYDWQQDGIPDHIGIVVDCDGSTIHVIEGNGAGERCVERWIPVGDPSISCFGAPNYTGKMREKEDDLKEVSNLGGDVYRLYNPNDGHHHYTTSKNEREALIGLGWQDEGIAFTMPKGGVVAIYRMYNPNNGFHMHTASFNEAEALQKAGWRYEGVPFFAKEDGSPIYRLYNPNSGEHLWLPESVERRELPKVGWQDEGVAWYV